MLAKSCPLSGDKIESLNNKMKSNSQNYILPAYSTEYTVRHIMEGKDTLTASLNHTFQLDNLKAQTTSIAFAGSSPQLSLLWLSIRRGVQETRSSHLSPILHSFPVQSILPNMVK